MSDFAHEVSPTSPSQSFDASPATLQCSLCTTVLAVGSERCPSCGLWMGGHGRELSRSTLLRVTAAFAGLYGVALCIVALAR